MAATATRTTLFSRKLPGGVLTIADLFEHPGAIVFLDSVNGNAAYGGQSPDVACATLTQALALCVADRGDVIYAMPGHAESKTTTGNIVDVNIAGVRIIGLGRGSKMAKFTLGHAGTTFTVSAADVTIRAVKILSDVADCAVGVTAGAGADFLSLEGCRFESGSLVKELKIGVSIADACTDVNVEGCRFSTFTTDETGSETHAVFCAGAADRLRFVSNHLFGNFGTAALAATVSASIGVEIRDNRIHNIDSTNGLAISLHASTTGVVSDNRALGLKVNTIPIVAAGCAHYENYTTAAVNESGLLKPTAETFA